MTSSSERSRGRASAPPPADGKAARPQAQAQAARPNPAYTRFIPREELHGFASWRPGAFGAAAAEPGGAPAASAPPTPSVDWPARIAAARQAGYQEGYGHGLQGLESFKQHFAAQATAQIGTLLEAFDRQLVELDARIAQTLAEAAVQLAREVVRSELATRPQLVVQVAVEAVNAVMLSARHITVRVHPNDLPLVAEGAEEALGARGARLQADAAVERGGVRVDSDVGAIDARIAQRWAQAAATLDGTVPWPADARPQSP